MPFAETYLAGADPENYNHFGGFRYRVQGAGDLIQTIYTLDKIRQGVLLPFSMEEVDQDQPTRLCNFTTQRAILRVETDEIDDFMKFNRIIFWVKPIWSQGPGTR